MEKTTTKKTAKYYRDIISKKSVHSALVILPEVIKKYGGKRWDKYSKGNDIIRVKEYTEFEWNHQIEAFYLNDKGKLCVDIYWQGDSTDGNTSEYASDLVYGKVIPAEWDEIGGEYGMEERHSPLRISKEEFEAAIKAVAKYLSPEEIKKRKLAEERSKKSDVVFKMIDAEKEDLERWEMERYWNGRIAVQKVLEAHKELLDLPIDQLKPTMMKVYKNNFKDSADLRGGYYNGEKKYNLAY